MKVVKKAAVTLVYFMLLFCLATPAYAAITTATAFETASKMYQLGIIQGRGILESGDIDFDLGSNLTRAELVTAIVRSFGAEQAAQLVKGAPSFADVDASDWFSGYVAVAKNLAEQAGTTIGRDANTFDPNAYVTKAEALVFVMKYLGIKVESSGANWYEAWIQKAIELGMITEEDAAVALSNPGAPATRGEAFVILDFGYSARLLEGGNSLYSAFVDSVLPVVELDRYPETTTASEITLTGKASDNKGVASVSISDGTSQSAIDIIDGTWQVTVPLKPGLNSFTIEAVDLAGNRASKQINIKRIAAERLQIKNKPSLLGVGQPYRFEAVLLDADGNVFESDIPVKWSATGGFIDPSGRYTTLEKGTYTITATWGDLVDTAQVNVVEISAYVNPPSSPPLTPELRLHPVPDLVWHEGENVGLTFTADIPIDAASSAQFRVTGHPEWLELHELNGELTGIVPYDAAGEYHLTVALIAEGYMPSTISFKITVLNTDTTPYWDSDMPEEFTLSMGDDFFVIILLDVYAHDDDGDELEFIPVELHPNLVLTGSELCITEPGTYEVTIKVRDLTPSEDSSRDEATITFRVIVTD